MKVVNPNDNLHLINLIPRFFPLGVLILDLYNETTQISTDVPNLYVIVDGILSMEFDFTFKEGDKFQIRIKEGNNEVYRGKLIATTQLTQDYKARNQYFYKKWQTI